jgi:hypothetical protein
MGQKETCDLEKLTEDQFLRLMRKIERKYWATGVYHGFPIPLNREDLRLRGDENYPFFQHCAEVEEQGIEEHKAREVNDGSKKEPVGISILTVGHSDKVVYSWKVSRPWKGKQGTVFVIRNENEKLIKIFVPEITLEMARIQFLFNTVYAREGATFIKAEKNAQKRLQRELSEHQWKCYFLEGCFRENGKSGVFYVLRKGRPTLAFRDGNFLASLCLHPFAYYDNSFAGTLPPSDEVIAHLLMIRRDERYYWRKAEQHQLHEVQSGI